MSDPEEMPLNEPGGWHAYEDAGPSWRGRSHRHMGRFRDYNDARHMAGRGGYVEPDILTPEQAAEEGFPKSYQEFVT